MKSIILFLFVAVFAAVLIRAEVDKTSGQVESNDVLDQAFYGIDSLETDESDSNSGEEEDDETTTPLPTRGGGRHRFRGKNHRHNHRAKAWRKTMTPEEKFEFICRAIKSKSNFFQSRKMSMKLRRLEPEAREKFQAAISARTTAMSECCLLNSTEGIQCAEIIKNQRYTRVCNGEEPLCIWSLLKGRANSNQHSETVSKCCELQDEARNTCFQESKQKKMGQYHGRHRKYRD